MFDFFRLTISPLNLPFTLLLGLAAAYWILILIGAADADFLPDMDADMDADGGVFAWISQALSLSDIPVMVVVSILLFNLWALSMTLNYYFNPSQSVLLGAGLFFVNLFLSFSIAVIIVRLFLGIFGTKDGEEPIKALYSVGTVVSGQADENFGQVEISDRGSSIKINVRTVDGRVFNKGDQVVVFDEDPERGIYFVEKYSQE